MTIVLVNLRDVLTGPLPRETWMYVRVHAPRLQTPLVVPIERTVVIPASGVASFEVDPTGPDEAVQLRPIGWGIDGTVWTVAIPDVESIGLGELVREHSRDPATLDPAAAPEAAWTAALAAVTARVDELETTGAPAGPPTGGAGGFLAGNYPNPGVNTTALAAAIEAVVGSGGGVHLGEGAPPDLIVGAKVGDIYIDTITGMTYLLEGN